MKPQEQTADRWRVSELPGCHSLGARRMCGRVPTLSSSMCCARGHRFGSTLPLSASDGRLCMYVNTVRYASGRCVCGVCYSVCVL